MGEEIGRRHLTAQDFQRFEQLLAAENDQAQKWMRPGCWPDAGKGGFKVD